MISRPVCMQMAVISSMPHFTMALLGLWAALGAPALALARAAASRNLLLDEVINLDDPLLSEVSCIGKEAHTRTCHFKDLVYNIDTGRFQVYTDESTAASLSWVQHQHAAGEPFLQLGVYVSPGSEPDGTTHAALLCRRTCSPP